MNSARSIIFSNEDMGGSSTTKESTPSSMRVRLAREADIVGIAKIWHEVYHLSHGEILPGELLKYRDYDSFERRVPWDLARTIVVERSDEDGTSSVLSKETNSGYPKSEEKTISRGPEEQCTTSSDVVKNCESGCIKTCVSSNLVGFVSTKFNEVMHLFVRERGLGAGSLLLRAAEAQILANVQATSGKQETQEGDPHCSLKEGKTKGAAQSREKSENGGESAVQAFLYVADGNFSAQKFYEKQGWRYAREEVSHREIFDENGNLSTFPLNLLRWEKTLVKQDLKNDMTKNE
ncbi:unnamed protein product [Amoebophrya sp. A25]|nr:unnamed protein product [Amoebophrya sp. A25]|eukprot:GSA25T00025167001.1